MSFFGNLLAGVATGGAAGYIQDQSDNEKLTNARLLQREKADQALELQRQRGEDRAFQVQLANQSKTGGGGTKDFNLAALTYEAMQSGDPAKLRALESVAGLMGGDPARKWMQYNTGGGGGQTEAAPTEQDVLQSMAYTGAPQPPANTTMGASEAAEALTAFNRAFAMATGKDGAQDYSKAERQYGLNDFGTGVAQQTLQRGGTLQDAATDFQRYSGTKDESEKNAIALQRIEASLTNAGTRASGTMANTESRNTAAEVRQLEESRRRITENLYDPMKSSMPGAKDAFTQQLAEINTQLALLRGAPASAQPPAQPAQWGASSPTSKPKSLTDALRRYGHQ